MPFSVFMDCICLTSNFVISSANFFHSLRKATAGIGFRSSNYKIAAGIEDDFHPIIGGHFFEGGQNDLGKDVGLDILDVYPCCLHR